MSFSNTNVKMKLYSHQYQTQFNLTWENYSIKISTRLAVLITITTHYKTTQWHGLIRLLLWIFLLFLGIMDFICHPSYSMIGATRDGFPILLMGIIHLSTQERHWSKWSASAPFTIYYYYPYTSFITCGSVFPLFVHLVNKSHILPFKAVCSPLLRITVP